VGVLIAFPIAIVIVIILVAHSTVKTCISLLRFLIQRITAKASPAGNQPGRTAVRILSAFKYFCGKENREIVEIVMADIRRDVRQLRNEKRGPLFIRTVVLCRIGGTVLPIIWDLLIRILKSI